MKPRSERLMQFSVFRYRLSIFFLTGLVLIGCDQSNRSVPLNGNGPDLVFDVEPGSMTIQLLREPVLIEPVGMTSLNGKNFSTTDWLGKVTLVNFWATWCGPCREEIPDLIQLQDRYPDHLRIIGISTDEGTPEMVKAFSERMGINYPVVMATPELNRQFPGVFALPTSFIVDPKGNIVQTHVGLINPAVFEQETRHLASLPTTVDVELVDGNDTTRLVNAAHATEIPGLDLSELTPTQKERVLQRLNEDGCPCGCSLTLAQCRINDSSCGISPPLAQKVLDEVISSN